MTRHIETIIDDILNIFYDNDGDLFNRCIEELDDCVYNYLGEDRYRSMSDLFLIIQEASRESLEQILSSIVYGEDTRGSKFDPLASYYKMDVYGNYVSSDEVDYWLYLNQQTIRDMCKHYKQIYSISHHCELCELMEELYEQIAE